LCDLRDLADPGSRGFGQRGQGAGAEFFLVRKDGRVFGYLNRCPHTGAPLEWQPDQFLDLDGAFIQCAVHGALFRPEDGRCVRGPCAGQALEPVAVVVRDERVLLRGPLSGSESVCG
jgi:nitrite reductase/ring-hydroxylating ferredoxin subunit